MKKSAAIPLLPTLILIGAISVLSGCAAEEKCASGQTQLPPSWVEAKFPVLEGGSICMYDGDKYAGLTYKNMESFELHDKYAEKFKSEGWEFSLGKPDRTYYCVKKNEKSFCISFTDCSKTFSKCASASVTRIE